MKEDTIEDIGKQLVRVNKLGLRSYTKRTKPLPRTWREYPAPSSSAAWIELLRRLRGS